MLLLKDVILDQMELFSWAKFWKRKLWKGHNLGASFCKQEHLKAKLYIINKGAIVTASYRKKNKTIFKILTLQKLLTIRCSGKLWNLCSQTNVLTERVWLVKDDKMFSENLEVAEIFNIFFFFSLQYSKRNDPIFRLRTSD